MRRWLGLLIHRLRGRTCENGWHLPEDVRWTVVPGEGLVVERVCRKCRVPLTPGHAFGAFR